MLPNQPPIPSRVSETLLDHDLACCRVRAHLRKARAAMVRLAGPPGAGKTALVAATLQRLSGHCRVAVVVVNPAAERDAALLRPSCVHCDDIASAVPDPLAIANAVEAIDPATFDLIIVEACGGIMPFPCIGEDAVVAVLGVSCGDDKAAEYRSLISRSSMVLLTKTDLLPFIRFSGTVFHNDVQQINPQASVLELSIINGHGLDQWLRWLQDLCAAARRNPASKDDCGSELFVG